MLEKSTIIILMLFLSSCSYIDVTDLSCEKMSKYSSIKVSELIDKPKVVTIDNKDLRLRFTINKRVVTINGRTFPNNILPEVVNNCSNSSFGYMFHQINYKESFFLEPYSVEKVWFIDTINEIWETSNITSNYNLESPNTPNAIKINGSIPSFKNIVSNVVVKFKYKEKDYFIRYDFNDRY